MTTTTTTETVIRRRILQLEGAAERIHLQGGWARNPSRLIEAASLIREAATLRTTIN